MPRNKEPSLGRCMFLISSHPCTIQVRETPEAAVQGYLAHENPPPPAWDHHRGLGIFLL